MKSQSTFLALLLTILLLGITPMVGRMQPPVGVYNVDTTADEQDAAPGDGQCLSINGVCSLRAAIMEANATGGLNVITFANPGTFTLGIAGANEDAAATGDLDILDDLVMIGRGTGQTVIDGGGIDRVFHTDPAGKGVIVNLFDLTIQNGHSGDGGGIMNGVPCLPANPCTVGLGFATSLTLTNVVLRANVADTLAFASGGALSNYAALKLNTVVMDNNQATVGGGLFNGYQAQAELMGVTISNNVSTLNAAFLPGGGGVFNSDQADIHIQDSEIWGNTTGTVGGGAVNEGSLTAERTSFRVNTSTRWGGGLWNGGAASLTDTFFSANVSASGGGIFNNVSATIDANRVTLSENSALPVGGGVTGTGGGALRNNGAVSLVNVTITSNKAAPLGGGISGGGSSQASLQNVTVSENQASLGGGIFSAPGSSVHMVNTLLAQQTVGGNCSGAVTSQGYNLDSDDSCGLNAAGDLVKVDAMLGPLAYNGGVTPTRALLRAQPGLTPDLIKLLNSLGITPPLFFSGSAAIDTGNDALCPPDDQNGFPRPQGAHCDIGAYEAS